MKAVKIPVFLPIQYDSAETFYVVGTDGRMWDRHQRKWQDALNVDSNPPYVKLGHAKRAVANAKTKSDADDVVVVALSRLEEFYETLPKP